MIPCYVSGKGLHAGEITRHFKIVVIQELESSGLGYDTRFRFYRRQFPDLDPEELMRVICDPVEFYDREWTAYLGRHRDEGSEEEILARFISERDALFRGEARVAIYCYDEAGLGSGVNSMRFIREGKRILGFYNPEAKAPGMNLTNVIQLRVEHPELVTLVSYRSPDEIPPRLSAWLSEIPEG